MPNPPRRLISPRSQGIVLGLVAIALALVGFQAGRRSVDGAVLAKTLAIEPNGPVRDVAPRRRTLFEHDQKSLTVREIATVPFSELYDVLKSASHEQLLAWARDLEQMPRGPRQRAAVTAYYKSLIQVDHRTAIDAVFRAQNLPIRDAALEAITKAAPESIWGELAEALAGLPFPKRVVFGENIISNWSAVDPVAAAKFVETNPLTDPDDRLVSLLHNWGEIDPHAAREWLEADHSRQTKDAVSAFVNAWARTDRPAAIGYALANALRPEFEDAIKDLASGFLREEQSEATRLMLLLPPESAKAALKQVARDTASGNFHLSDNDERSSDLVLRWMLTLPIELWKDAAGGLVDDWLTRDPGAATNWLDQLRPDLRDAAIASFCRGANSGSVEQVLALSQTITDRQLRDRSLREFARTLRWPPYGSIDAVDQLPISEKQKAYLRTLMPETPDEP
jgi:hypothetical protein